MRLVRQLCNKLQKIARKENQKYQEIKSFMMMSMKDLTIKSSWTRRKRARTKKLLEYVMGYSLH